MAATMDKKDVLYRVAYKNLSSIKWGEITKIAGKETPQTIKDEVKNLLDDKSHTKMEAKVGMLRKGEKIDLVLRVKNGNKHLYDKVLFKDFIPPTESVTESVDQDQKLKLKKAHAEVDEVFKQTQTLNKTLKLLSEKLTSELEQHESVFKKVVREKVTTSLFVQLSTACQKRKKLIEELKDKATNDLAKHKSDINGFRQGGVGRLAGRLGVNEDGIVELTKRFAEHSNLLYQAEQKVKNLLSKAKEFTGQITQDLQLVDINIDPMKAYHNYLANSLQVGVDRRENQQTTYGKGTASYLKYDANNYPLETVETGIAFCENKLVSSQKVYDKTCKQLQDAAKKIPKSALENFEVKEDVEKIENFILDWKLELERFTLGCQKAIAHLKKVQQEIVNQNK